MTTLKPPLGEDAVINTSRRIAAKPDLENIRLKISSYPALCMLSKPWQLMITGAWELSAIRATQQQIVKAKLLLKHKTALDLAANCLITTTGNLEVCVGFRLPTRQPVFLKMFLGI
jgi:hypothetical protein